MSSYNYQKLILEFERQIDDTSRFVGEQGNRILIFLLQQDLKNLKQKSYELKYKKNLKIKTHIENAERAFISNKYDDTQKYLDRARTLMSP